MSGPVVTVRVDASLDDVVATMEKHQIRRVPVVDESDACVGIIAQADVSWAVSSQEVAELVREVSRDTGRESGRQLNGGCQRADVLITGVARRNFRRVPTAAARCGAVRIAGSARTYSNASSAETFLISALTPVRAPGSGRRSRTCTTRNAGLPRVLLVVEADEQRKFYAGCSNLPRP